MWIKWELAGVDTCGEGSASLLPFHWLFWSLIHLHLFSSLSVHTHIRIYTCLSCAYKIIYIVYQNYSDLWQMLYIISQVHMPEFLGSGKWGSEGFHNTTKYYDSVIENKCIKISGAFTWKAYGKFRLFKGVLEETFLKGSSILKGSLKIWNTKHYFSLVDGIVEGYVKRVKGSVFSPIESYLFMECLYASIFFFLDLNSILSKRKFELETAVVTKLSNGVSISFRCPSILGPK